MSKVPNLPQLNNTQQSADSPRTATGNSHHRDNHSMHHDGAHTSSIPPSPRRFGTGNPLINTGATIIGLGTVGLGDRCGAERKEMHKQSFQTWKRQKEEQEIAARQAAGGSTPKKPLTSKEAYVRQRQEDQQKFERRQDAEMETARKCREDQLKLKSDIHSARNEDKQFVEAFRSYVKEENSATRERRKGSPLHETPEARARRVHAEMEERRKILQTVASDQPEEYLAHALELHAPVAKVPAEMMSSLHHLSEAKQKEYKQQKKEISSRKKLLKAMDTEREADLKFLAKQQKVYQTTKISEIRDKLYEDHSKSADRVREMRPSKSRDAAQRAEEERQHQHLEERKRQQEAHELLIRQTAEMKKGLATDVRRFKSELGEARNEDREEVRQRKMMLHQETLETTPRSPQRRVLLGSAGSPAGVSKAGGEAAQPASSVAPPTVTSP